VDDTGPAGRAGLRPGDLLVRAGRRELRSVSDLHASLTEAGRGGRVRLTIVRGERRRTVAARLPD
jgi:S1-C subfamily serine protease